MPRTVTWIFVGAQVMAALALLIGTTAVVAAEWLLPGRTLLAQATGFDGIVLVAVAAAVFFYARGFTGSRLLALSLDPAEPDVVGRWVAAGGTALWATGWILGSNNQPLLLVGSATALVVAILLWAVHDTWADIGWQWLIVIAGGTLTALLLVTFVPRQIALPGVLAPARGLLLAGAAVLLLMIVLRAATFAVSRCVSRVSRLIATAIMLVVVTGSATFGSWWVLGQGAWLEGGLVPQSLLFGAVVAAATTAVVPFREALPEPDDQTAESSDRTKTARSGR